MFLCLLFALLFFPALSNAQGFAFQLCVQGDAYRCLSETQRLLSMRGNRLSPVLKLSLYEAQGEAAWKLSDYSRAAEASRNCLQLDSRQASCRKRLILSQLALGKEQEAEASFLQGNPETLWLRAGEEQGHQSPRLAQGLNYLLPGAGFAYLGSWGKGLGSFFLNGIFLKAIADAWAAGNRAQTLVFFTFEAGWYLGGAKAAGIAAEEGNKKRLQRQRIELLRLSF